MKNETQRIYSKRSYINGWVSFSIEQKINLKNMLETVN